MRIFCFVFFWLSFFMLFGCNINSYKNSNLILSDALIKENSYEEKITALKKEYQNPDVMGIVSIENTDFRVPVMQGEDNEYYLNHLPDKSYNINGSVFFDYRLDVENASKILIFGHSSPSYDLPIEIIQKYQDKSFWQEHKYIYLETEQSLRKYLVFSTYVETSDFDYMTLEFASNKEKERHFYKLKNNSFYDTGVSVKVNDSILIMQTCSTLKEYNHYPKKYYLLIAKLVEN